MAEIWKDIAGYEGLYQVSNLGNVKRLTKYTKGGYIQKEKILKQRLNYKGRCTIGLTDRNKITKRFQVHRLVGLAFLPNPNNLPQINHIDEDPTNNWVDNLEWCDNKYNALYGTRIQRIAEGNSKPIIAVNIYTGEKKEYSSLTEAQIDGFNKSNICSVLKGLRKTHKKHTFYYVNKEEVI